VLGAIGFVVGLYPANDVGFADAVVLLGAVLDNVVDTVLRTLLNDTARIAKTYAAPTVRSSIVAFPAAVNSQAIRKSVEPLTL
jgi:hypothetical protein